MSERKAWDVETARSRIEALAGLPGALLPILHAIQDEFSYIDRAAVPLIAERLNLSEAEVHGVISFYHDFREVPPGLHILKICRAEACQSMGCDATIHRAENMLGIRLGETTPDHNFTLEPVYCLGNCALSPAAMLDGKLYGRVRPDVVTSLIGQTREAIA